MYLIYALLAATLLLSIPNFYSPKRRRDLRSVLTTGSQLVLLVLSWQLLLSPPVELSTPLRLWMLFYSLVLGLHFQRALGSARPLKIMAWGVTTIWGAVAFYPEIVFTKVRWHENYSDLSYGWLGALYILGWLVQIIGILLRLKQIHPDWTPALLLSMFSWVVQLVCVGFMSAYFLPRTDGMAVVAAFAALAGLPSSMLASYKIQTAPRWTLSQELREKLYLPSLVGLYLFIIGTIGIIGQIFDWHFGWLHTLIGATGLLIPVIVVLLWPSLRQRLRFFIGRHFYPNQYDYRVIWKRVSDEFASVQNINQLGVSFAEMITDILGVPTIALYRVDEQHRLHLLVASSEELGQLSTLEQTMLDWLWRLTGTCLFSKDIPELFSTSRQMFLEYNIRLILPITMDEELIALVFLGSKENNDYTLEDQQLLQTIAHQLGIVIYNAQLNEQLALEHELGSITRMSTFVLHDLKNAVAMLTLMRNNFDQNWDNPQFREDLVFTLDAVQERVQRVIEKFSATRQEGLNLTRTDLDQLVLDAIQRAALDNKEGISIDTQFETKPKLIVDPERMVSVFENLLLNAVEAIEPSDGQITIRLYQQQNHVILEFTDNGVGIPQEFLQHRLFRPFQTTKPRGLGIGLYQCRTIIKAHGGTIEAASQEHQGTTIRIALPLS